MGYSKIKWVCPFFVWDERLSVHGECGCVRFPDFPTRKEYVSDHCANYGNGWRNCSMARSLLRYYERAQRDEDEA